MFESHTGTHYSTRSIIIDAFVRLCTFALASIRIHPDFYRPILCISPRQSVITHDYLYIAGYQNPLVEWFGHAVRTCV